MSDRPQNAVPNAGNGSLPSGDRAGEPAVDAQPAWELTGARDGFERLWTPHRMVYLRGEDKPADGEAGPHCPFCRAPGLGDESGLVVARGRTTYVVLNLYPYNTGHVMVCPYRHVALYPDLTGEETAELAEQTKTAMRVLAEVSGCQGFNLGMNQGAVAGAGIAAHLHQHIVPRWGGDANFLPIIASTKALPELLAETRARLAQAWPA
ncbi:MAG TPA: HIT domain-containing protein [Kineosporiaceae bacterium]|nr:HIT domain-containing protein [Kineosporiaceae bacterium]